jgi:hypothetical protein
MRLSLRLGGVTLLVFLGVSGVSGNASADGIDVGIRGGFYTDVDEPFLGVELLLGVTHSIYFNPNVEYVFVEGGSYLTVNGDFHYDLVHNEPYYFWLGAGLGLARIDPEGPDNSDSELVGNFLAGVGFRAGGAVPYVQGKIIVKDDTAASIAVGIRF